MIAVDPSKYAEELDYLVSYAREDLVGFHVVVGSATGLLGLDAEREQDIELTLRLVADLLAAGVRPGELDLGSETPFVPWPLDDRAALARIDAELHELDELPIADEICWFAVPRG
ncbi:hypothetical protein ACIRBX_07545 [Kitasatospora sp. NPDC096147]|uniref:hypothetical protein n=1 Tax=Kitasatospora sp. NPDC096147 TaxID=3364093 RepID=UPI0038110D04